ncbi:O-unit flippase [Clostridium botulinum]|nr:O-unit flippase [Clostridium botulinum]
MSKKKATINVFVSAITYVLSFIPLFIVRKIFLDTLGSQLLGISLLYTNIIGYLSLAEMGVGTAITFALYKPFRYDSREIIKGYLDYYKRFYRIIGIIVFILAILLLPFLKVFIIDDINMFEARVYFLLFIINTIITYIFSYKLCLLTVAEEGYKISIGTTLSKLIISFIQCIILKIYLSFYMYIITEIIINLLYYIIINKYIDTRYPWLLHKKGKIGTEEKAILSKNIKALFIHKIGGVAVFGTDNILISSFINLDILARYNSYYLIIKAFQGIITTSMESITPSIGNLIAEDMVEELYEVYKRVFFITFWISSFVCIASFNTITQFIKLWLGTYQTLDRLTVSIIIINMYFQLMRIPIDNFKNGAGIFYQDRYAPIAEIIVNLIFSIFLINIIGLPGVFIGTLISNITVIFWAKPLVTYKYVFHRKLIDFFKLYFKYLLIGMIPLILTSNLTSALQKSNSIIAFIINCSINILVINLFYLIIFWRSEEFNYFKFILIKIFYKLKTYIIIRLMNIR